MDRDFSAKVWKNGRRIMQLEVYKIVQISRTERAQELISVLQSKDVKNIANRTVVAKDKLAFKCSIVGNTKL